MRHANGAQIGIVTQLPQFHVNISGLISKSPGPHHHLHTGTCPPDQWNDSQPHRYWWWVEMCEYVFPVKSAQVELWCEGWEWITLPLICSQMQVQNWISSVNVCFIAIKYKFRECYFMIILVSDFCTTAHAHTQRAIPPHGQFPVTDPHNSTSNSASKHGISITPPDSRNLVWLPNAHRIISKVNIFMSTLYSLQSGVDEDEYQALPTMRHRFNGWLDIRSKLPAVRARSVATGTIACGAATAKNASNVNTIDSNVCRWFDAKNIPASNGCCESTKTKHIFAVRHIRH